MEVVRAGKEAELGQTLIWVTKDGNEEGALADMMIVESDRHHVDPLFRDPEPDLELLLARDLELVRHPGPGIRFRMDEDGEALHQERVEHGAGGGDGEDDGGAGLELPGLRGDVQAEVGGQHLAVADEPLLHLVERRGHEPGNRINEYKNKELCT